MVLFAFSAFGCTLPHFIFGNKLINANNAFYGPASLGTTSIMQSSIHNSTTNITEFHMNLCSLNSNGSMGSGTGKIFCIPKTVAVLIKKKKLSRMSERLIRWTGSSLSDNISRTCYFLLKFVRCWCRTNCRFYFRNSIHWWQCSQSRVSHLYR